MAVDFGVVDISFAALESAYDTFAAFAAADAIGRISLNLRPTLNLLRRAEHRGSQSIAGHDKDKYGGDWDLSAELKVTTPAGDFPELSVFLEAAMGQKTDAGASVNYTHLLKSLLSLQLGNFNGTDFGEIANGCWLRNLRIAHEGSQYVMVSASGGFASYARLHGAPLVDGAHAQGASTIGLSSGHASKIISGLLSSQMVVDFGAGLDNSGAGYTITAVDYDADELTISPAIAAGDDLSGGEEIRVLVPTPAFEGLQVGTTEGITAVDGADLDYTRFSYELDTGIQGSALEGSRNRPSRLELSEDRVVSGEFAAYSLDENAHLQAKAANDDPVAIAHRFGPDTAGARFKINVPAAALTLFPIEKSEKGPYMIAAAYEGEQSAAPEDESSLVVD